MKLWHFLLIPFLNFFLTLQAQQVNQISIFPENPAENDSINIVSDFSYVGECSYGMVYSYQTMIEDTMILIIPTYCGYWLTTPCNSIDTFKIGVFPVGNYTLRIEYHQGSVCPISGFDATIASFDTVLTVTGTTGLSMPETPEPVLFIYPNPAGNQIIVDLTEFENLSGFLLIITNLSGQTVFQSPVHQTRFYTDTSNWEKGMYWVSVINPKGKTVAKRKFVIQ